MDDETKAAFGAVNARFDDMMARMNDQFERVINEIQSQRQDFLNAKGFLLEDALIMGRRLYSVEKRLDELERKPPAGEAAP